MVESAYQIAPWLANLRNFFWAARPFHLPTLLGPPIKTTNRSKADRSILLTRSSRMGHDWQAPLDSGHIDRSLDNYLVHMSALCFVHLQTCFTAPRLCNRSQQSNSTCSVDASPGCQQYHCFNAIRISSSDGAYSLAAEHEIGLECNVVACTSSCAGVCWI